MASNFDEIWTFLEEKLKDPVPGYVKNILNYCGYNNGISIATIEEDDIQYFVQQVRSGNVTNHFRPLIEGKNVLEGSPKTIENFEFSRGHLRHLMYIVNFLKNYIEENGSDCFSKIDYGRKRPIQDTDFSSNKRKKHKHDIVDLSDKNLKKQEGILLSKTITSVVTLTYQIYIKHFKIINNRIALANLVKVDIDKSTNESRSVDRSVRYIAKIICPLCSHSIKVSHTSEQLSTESIWNTVNLDEHLKIHQNCNNFELAEESNFDTPDSTPEISGLLQKFVDSAKRNYPRKKAGYRHDNVTKMFAAFIKMIAGLLAYETLHANFPFSLPSVSTVNRFISDNGPHIIEGSMRTNELVQYLQSRNLPLKVSLSEDATRITPKISYDPITNQLIGFALQLDVNGMPMKLSFPARNLDEIKKHFTNTSNVMSSSAYVQMAQPIDETVPPFCLMIYLTDSTFTAKNILKRWKFQAENLKENGITIDNIATDGDARPLSVMKCLSRIGIQNLTYLNCEWFSCGGHMETTFSQDLIHIITKLRNRLLKFSRIFPFGSKVISLSYLKYLIEQVSKDKHLLNPSDIEPKDRQNFLSAEKLCSDKVIRCLLDYIPGSEGTALYLKAMNYILTAYLNINIKSQERIFLMFSAVFFFRGWRSWLLNSEKVKSATNTKPKKYYNLKDNFISSNCYTCIEINAHTLVKKALIGSPSEGQSSKFFFPNLYGSQPCESMFRQVRSFTSTFLTVVNCNMLDILHRIKKIQLQNDIVKNSNGELRFPRFERKVDIASNRPLDAERNIFESLSRTEVIAEIERARTSVICDMEELGIDTSKLNFHCQVKPVLEEDIMNTDLDNDSEDEDMEVNDFFESDDMEPDEEIQEDIRSLSGITGDLLLRDYRGVQPDSIHLEETSPFVVVIHKKGKEMVVRKSSICWLLSKNKYRLSSDRLQRVQEKEYTNNSESNTIISGDNYFVKTEITVGEWCIFSENSDERNVVIGQVLGFSYFNGKTFKDREYSKSTAPVESNSTIGVLSTFYSFNSEGELTSLTGDKHKYIGIELYVGTIKHPSYTNKTLTISDKLLNHINAFTDGR